MSSIAANLSTINQTIQHSAQIVNRHRNEIQLIAVSKKKPASDILQAYQAGQRHFGENYVQEGCDKVNQLAHLNDIVWHFIGPIQSNKSRAVAQAFDWVHTIDRDKIAQRLNDQRSPELSPLNVCIQVNIEQESTKAGVTVEQVLMLANKIATLPRLQLRGIMAIPSKQATAEKQATVFEQIKQAYLQLQQHYPKVDTLSLGMSNDMQTAIAAGSTMIRVGTAIFGQRTP